MAANQPNLLCQISELQKAVDDMKVSLKEAVSRLSLVSPDEPPFQYLKELQDARHSCDSNTAHILKKEITGINDRQEALQVALWQILEERKLLISDLVNTGAISTHTSRSRLEEGIVLPDAVGGFASGRSLSGSGSHSNDSGVALLLEKANQDSLPEQPSLLVPHSVYDYVAGLGTSATQSSLSAHSAYSAPPMTMSDPMTKPLNGDCDEAALAYDSDSSLTIAANKTISLSTSLSQEMRVVPTDERRDLGVRSVKRFSRTDSDGSDQSRDAVLSRKKRSSHEDITSLGLYGTPRSNTKHFHCHQTYSRRSHHMHFGDPQEGQRYRVARELLDTEKKYCKTLWTIQDVFAEPLKKSGILTTKDITTLFPDEVYLLYEKHCLLQHQLRERLASWKWQPIVGDILARFTDPRQTDVLRLYTAYVNDFPEVLKTFHRLCRTSPQFTKFIKACLEQPSCGGLDLGAFLLTPVQRVPRYILILKHLLKYTDHNHIDYRNIYACLDRLRDFLNRLNDSMEHSFQLVHATLSPPVPPIISPESNAAVIRSSTIPRRTSSSVGSPPTSPSYSERLSGEDYCHSSPDRKQKMSSPNNPQRSSSTADQLSPRSRNVNPSKSCSLPRKAVPPTSESRSSFEESRMRSRSESVTSKISFPLKIHPHSLSGSPEERSPRGMAAARSVADVTAHENDCRSWGDLAASEPSLFEPRQQNTHVKSDSGLCNSTSQSIHNMTKAPSTASWQTEVGSSHDDSRIKKKSIKSSLKNMFSFKKSRISRIGYPHHTKILHHQHAPFHHQSQQQLVHPPLHHYYSTHQRSAVQNCPEEDDYWESPQSGGNSTSSIYASKIPQPIIVGDFVDEDGNPCSNV